jgi:YesN/AraC family two-component response regulator
MDSEDSRPVLIIDKSIARTSLGSEALAKNFHLMESNSDEEGLAMARELRPDVMIYDISDPSHGGLSVCQQLKSDAYMGHVSIILLGPIEQRTAGLQAGADGYISVPFDSHVLTLKIENLIRLRDAMRCRAVQEMSVQSELDVITDQFLTKMEQMVFENISDPNFGVKDMAFRIGISVSVLYRKLRSLKNITVNKFVKKIRMERAMKLLEAGIYPVNEVAASIGYEDSKYFSREFRKFFGKTPMEVKHRIHRQ